MKIGDLVKYKKSLRGLENCMGVIIGLSGPAFVIQWLDQHSKFVPGSEKSVEIPDFLEVVSETR